MKSGCQIEELQLEEEERIERATAVYCVVAWRLLFITYLARKDPDKSSSGIVEQSEWEAMYCFTHKTTSPPSSAPSLSELVRQIAKLGGFIGRKVMVIRVSKSSGEVSDTYRTYQVCIKSSGKIWVMRSLDKEGTKGRLRPNFQSSWHFG
ncbi:MAG: hypothetical protein M1470_01095 [Bacteroidetes bacterium]|nr:hypothetical protein [Bacteroidota bacterium]MCL5738574.1 hypothetical protein [Bacteroidota bacterium]